MLYSSAEINKIIKSLYERMEGLYERESAGATYVIEKSEREKDVRPDFNFKANLEEIEEIQSEILYYKDILNEFNLTTVLPSGLTISQTLALLPMLHHKKKRLSAYSRMLPKERVPAYKSSFVEYRCTNFDKDFVEDELERVITDIQTLQLELDHANLQQVIEVPDEEEE